MYYLVLFSESEMKKTIKQQKSNNTFLQLKLDIEWDMVKAQLLMKIMQTLQLRLIDFNDYDFMWNIPCQQSSQMQLQMDDDYKFLVAHALKMEEPAVNVKIEVRVAKKGKKSKKKSKDSKKSRR
ncbi:hypothetical protein EDC04DRAFT_2603343 [Pisolithus marmoratus]|nr:hypothetical protein EDC04DRAFT_2603343 [Pisolithus marmoratus]